MTSEKHLYAIPTNRDASKSIKSLANDIAVAIDEHVLLPEQLIFVLLDSSTQATFDRNHAQLKASFKALKITCLHIPVSAFDAHLNQALDPKLAALVVGSGFSYGKMVNKISIIAHLLGAHYIHRRDSDVYLQANNTQITPLIAEMRAFNENDQFLLVGSSYLGAWGIDYSDVADDLPTLRKLFSLSKPTYSPSQLDDYINNKYVQGSTETFPGDLAFSEQKSNYIDAGNFALKEVFLKIPVSPANVTSGTDYLYHTLVGKSGWRMVYHNDRVVHQYNENRYDQIDHLTYGNSKLLSRLMTTVTNSALTDVSLSDDFNDMAQQVAAAYLSTVDSAELLAKLKTTIQKFVAVYASIDLPHYQAIATNVAQQPDAYLEKTITDVHHFIDLIQNWPAILKNTQALELAPFSISADNSR